MTITKCYVDTFKDTLIAAGFRRSGKLFYRSKGDTIQSILLDTLSPFRLFYTVYPYWCHRFVGIKCNQSIELLKKALWAQGAMSTMGVFYRDLDDDDLQRVMQSCLQMVINKIIPYFDSHTDEASCLSASFEPTVFVSSDEPVICDGNEFWATTKICSWKHQYLLLWKAYLDGSFSDAYRMMENDVRNYRSSERERYERDNALKSNYMKNIQQHIAILAETCPEMSADEAYAEAYRIWGPNDTDVEAYLDKSCNGFIKAQYSVFLSRMQENDINWIKNIRDEETAIMKKAFADVYGIKFD